MIAKRIYFGLALITIVVASYRPPWERLVWDLFAVAFLCAADQVKNIERAKWKARETTEIEMKQEMLKQYDDSLAQRYAFMTAHIAKAMESASLSANISKIVESVLKQVADWKDHKES